jgi:DNA-binding protein H-NS
MAKSYEQLQRQIAALQAEAEELRQKEVGEVIARIRTAIDHYGISATDLGFGSPAAKTGAGAPERKKPGPKGRTPIQAAWAQKANPAQANRPTSTTATVGIIRPGA